MDLLITCLNLWAFIVNLAVLLICAVFYRRVAEGPARVSSIGGMAQSLAFVIAIIYSVNMLMNLGDPSEIGPHLAFILTTMLYGAVINVAAKIWARVLRGRENERSC